MEKEVMLSYEAPQVEVILVEVEKGFAQSNEPYSLNRGRWDSN